jgi:hypothetical protein
MKTKLSQSQIDQLNHLLEFTILPALQEDVCNPDMSDMKEDDDNYDNVWEDRMNVLYVEALNYLKNNLI